MKYAFATVLALVLPLAAPAAECEDGFCPIPTAEETAAEPVFEVVSPVPEAAVAPIAPAPRLDSLDGKTIALVGGSFMAGVTHPELRRLLLAEHPTAKVLLLDEIGSAGPYPRPGVVRREKDAFQRRLKENGVDAVVSGNGGCGLCTPKETGSCIAAEALGIPSAMIAAPGFVKQAKATAAAAGLAELRVAEYPGAFASHTREELLENTRKVLWPQVKSALTGAGPKVESPKSQVPGPAFDLRPATLDFESYDEFARVFLDSGWTDGLPVAPPTPERVAGFASRSRNCPYDGWSAFQRCQKTTTSMIRR